jgi:F-type H+/Na+-transporting ATPase subunit alpha
MAPELQVASIYAATRGFLDDLEVEQVSRFEQELHIYLKANHADLLRKVATTKNFKEADDDLRAAVDAFKKGFVAGVRAAVNH